MNAFTKFAMEAGIPLLATVIAAAAFVATADFATRGLVV